MNGAGRVQKRFDRRESRSDDVARIRQLERELRQAQALEKKQWAAANQLKLQVRPPLRCILCFVFLCVTRNPARRLARSTTHRQGEWGGDIAHLCSALNLCAHSTFLELVVD